MLPQDAPGSLCNGIPMRVGSRMPEMIRQGIEIRSKGRKVLAGLGKANPMIGFRGASRYCSPR
jgi:hypothetical protein